APGSMSIMFRRCSLIGNEGASRTVLLGDGALPALILTLSGLPAKQNAVIRRGRMHCSRRAAPEIVDGFDQRVQQPALEAENHQQRHENRRKQNSALDLSHAAFNLSHSPYRRLCSSTTVSG